MRKELLRFNSTRNRIYIFLQITLVVLAIGSYFYKRPISKNEIKEFGTVVKSKPKYLSSGDGHKYIEFKISDCEYKMQIENAALEALGNREKFLNDISVGDSVYISISNSNYQDLVLHKRKKRPLTGIYVHIYTLRFDNKNYISISKYNQYKKKDEFLGVLIGIGLFMLVVITIVKKIPLSVFLEKNWWIMLVVLFLILIYSWYF